MVVKLYHNKHSNDPQSILQSLYPQCIPMLLGWDLQGWFLMECRIHRLPCTLLEGTPVEVGEEEDNMK